MSPSGFSFEGLVRGLGVFADGPCEVPGTATEGTTLSPFFGLRAGLIGGVWILIGLLLAYGSAVAGRCPSGRRGRLRGPDRSEPDAPDAVGAAGTAFAVVAGGWRGSVVATAEGTRWPVDDDRVEACRRFEVESAGRTGEKVAIAELGRSGSLLAAAFF